MDVSYVVMRHPTASGWVVMSHVVAKGWSGKDRVYMNFVRQFDDEDDAREFANHMNVNHGSK